jgi:NAD(P)-dependent dehydrogenase (short-subunit alcohol dehydrogenase family)
VLVTGANRGLGLAIVQELVAAGAQVVATCRADKGSLPDYLHVPRHQIIDGVEVADNASVSAMVAQIEDASINVVINNAGYFPNIHETITEPENPLNFDEQLKQIDICALGPLRVNSALYQNGKLAPGCKLITISSQAGSAEWRQTQNKDCGGDYGHHMSRAACNIGGVLMSEELKKHGFPVVMLHPGFNRTDMTKKYEHIWDVEGAVPSEQGAKRVLHEVMGVDMSKTGQFINCEDGLQIPW